MQQVRRVAYNYETKLYNITSDASPSSNSSASASSPATSKTWDAEHVICTVPLGVLKGRSISFEPALSSDFTTALDSLGMGNQVRVTLLFDTVWWDSRDNFFLLSRPEFGAPQKRGLFTYFLNGRMLLKGRPVLVAFSSGEAASSAEGLSDAETWDLIRSNLVAMFGAAVPANHRGMLRSSWAADPWAKGTHSYPTTAASRNVWGSLQHKQGGTLFFAGEHTSPKHYGTLHGAIKEGLRAARALMDETRVFKELPTYGTGHSSGTGYSSVYDWTTAIFVCVASTLALAHTHEFM